MDDAMAHPAQEQLIIDHLPLVDAIARRYAGRGEPLDDLVQVGAVGLVKSAHRFDPERGVAFASYAAPTIRGEIRRHFRDMGWAVHVPRGLKDLALRVGRRAEELTRSLGRVPSIQEVAEAEGVSIDEAAEALEAAQAYAARSLFATRDDDAAEPRWVDLLGDEEPGFEDLELRIDLEPALEALDARERQIVMLRFWGGLVQLQIADRMGISQMHVSRLIHRSLDKMRDALEAEADAAAVLSEVGSPSAADARRRPATLQRAA